LNSLRIGCVKYLNALPLIHGWPEPVDFDHPSALCQRLANGELDVALVSSFEFLRNPIYRIVDGISISSDGPVYSVVVGYRGDISHARQIELDPASRTAANLLRCLLAELKLRPRVVPNSSGALSLPVEARLLIGDQAIRFRQKYASEFDFWDLGEEWKKLIGLPFVYALWLIRPEVADAKMMGNRLRHLRDNNIANLDTLIAKQTEFGTAFYRRYYREYLQFDFADAQKKGLKIFANLCAKYGLLETGTLNFDFV
jgi:chorismate dehydratase